MQELLFEKYIEFGALGVTALSFLILYLVQKTYHRKDTKDFQETMLKITKDHQEKLVEVTEKTTKAIENNTQASNMLVKTIEGLLSTLLNRRNNKNE